MKKIIFLLIALMYLHVNTAFSKNNIMSCNQIYAKCLQHFKSYINGFSNRGTYPSCWRLVWDFNHRGNLNTATPFENKAYPTADGWEVAKNHHDTGYSSGYNIGCVIVTGNQYASCKAGHPCVFGGYGISGSSDFKCRFAFSAGPSGKCHIYRDE